MITSNIAVKEVHELRCVSVSCLESKQKASHLATNKLTLEVTNKSVIKKIFIKV